MASLRPRHIELEDSLADTGPIRRHWFDDSAFKSMCANSLSVIVPESERFLMRTAQATYPHLSDPRLIQAADVLLHEEDAHSRVHDGYNALLVRQGYVIAPHEAFVRRLHAIIEGHMGLRTRLAACLCSEYLTALTAQHILALNLGQSGTVDPRMRRLWEWHTLEELDHRSTMHDLYLHMGGGYLRRCIVMLGLTLIYSVGHAACLASLIRQDRILSGVTDDPTKHGFLFGSNGFYWAISRGWIRFFRPGFHPQKDIRLDPKVTRQLHHYHIEEDIIRGLHV